jgi:predicted nucleic acid-binding protein
MRVLIDTNVVLDFLLEREPFVESAAKLFQQIDNGQIEGFITATTITNIYYILRKAAGSTIAIDAVSQILTDLNICMVDRQILKQAVDLNFQDFEDAVQYSCAVASQVDAIITRDTSGFVAAEIPVISPDELNTI